MEIIGFVIGVFAIAISGGLVWYCRSELAKVEEQTQAALNAMNQQHGNALQTVVEKQSEVNKVYKQHIEKILETMKWYSQILNYQDNYTSQQVNLSELNNLNSNKTDNEVKG